MSASVAFLGGRPTNSERSLGTSSWISVGTPQGAGYAAGAAHILPPARSAPTIGWGFHGDAGIFTAQCFQEGLLGLGFQKVENGVRDHFNFAMCISEVHTGSWAQKEGIEVGCEILSFNGEDVSGMAADQLREKLQNIRPVNLVLKRPTRTLQVPAAPTAFVSSKVERNPEVQGFLDMFATAFLLLSFAVFLTPIYLVVYIGEDMSARRWLPDINTRLVLILPVVYIITFLAHKLKGAPSKFFIVVSLIGSCLFLLILSDFLLFDAYGKGSIFASPGDCASHLANTQQQHDDAKTYYDNCAKEMAKKGKSTIEKVVAQLRIQDCPAYANASAIHNDWAYFEYLETTQLCSGWCTSSPPLWTKGTVRDACSPVVADIIHDKIAWAMRQVLFYAVFSLLASSILLMNIPSVLKRYGIEW